MADFKPVLSDEQARSLYVAYVHSTTLVWGKGDVMDQAEDPPCFEMVNPVTGQAFRIWADGRTQGFPEGFGMINRLPQIIAAEREDAVEDWRSGFDPPKDW